MEFKKIRYYLVVTGLVTLMMSFKHPVSNELPVLSLNDENPFYLLINPANSNILYGENIKRLSTNMTSRSLFKGNSTTAKAEIYYENTGKIVSHFIHPVDYFVISNSKGEVSLYNTKENTVTITQSLSFSTESSYFHFFLRDKANDMGLKDLGFKLNNTKYEEGLLITTWIPSIPGKQPITSIELAHENYKPIYLGYTDMNFKLFKKIYFNDYIDLKDLMLPQVITEIEYVSEKDSVIRKTTYSDFRINENAKDELINFKIPPNAKIEKLK